MSVSQFFDYARERHAAYLRRVAGLPRERWTRDKILREFSFTNVFRELDRTTQWFRKQVREPLRDNPEVLLATVLFRWFNRIQTGAAVFTPGFTYNGDEKHRSPFDEYLVYGEIDVLREPILTMCGTGPYVTGSYVVKSPDGQNKLDGVLSCVQGFAEGPWREAARMMQGGGGISHGMSLEDAWEWLRRYPYLGDFMSYEVVTDLRHTALLDRAPDIMTWANPGPGACRGLARVNGLVDKDAIEKEFSRSNQRDRAIVIRGMRALLEASRSPSYWPQARGRAISSDSEVYCHSLKTASEQWPAWEMRDVEHTLCEFDKYERVRLGQGRPRRLFRPQEGLLT